MRFLTSLLPNRQGIASLAMGCVLLAGCSSGGSDAADAANAQNQQTIGAADVTQKQEEDARFLVKAASNALLEIELGKLAQSRATTPDARAYGTALLQQRLQLLADLRTLAQAKKLVLPTALGDDEQAAYHEASVLKGAELDKQVVALLVKTQDQDEDAFDDMKDDAYDGDIRGFAAKYLPPVQDQLATANKLEDSLEDVP